MRVLVVSDSHSGLSYMQAWAKLLKPQVLIHLGDYFDDGQTLGEDFPGSRLIQVPGNCDLYRMINREPELRIVNLDGVCVFLTHGHRHGVKSSPAGLVVEARKAGADVALFGHTHQPVCWQTEDGMWVMNPGSCGSWGGTVGLMELEKGKVKVCRVLTLEDMEEFE